MSGNTASYEKFNYLLRPAKQIERKLVVESLHALAPLGYEIEKYRYIGLGSVYYADFVLFHKYLCIDDMQCAEYTQIPKRMSFNRPYDFIDLHNGPVSALLAQIDEDKKHLVWLDYDFPLNTLALQDTGTTAYNAPPGSAFLVTVDAEPRLPQDTDYDDYTEEKRWQIRAEELQGLLGVYLESPVTAWDLSPTTLPLLFARALRQKIKETIADRKDGCEFLQLYNFVYADGAQMLSLGGLLDLPENLAEVKKSGYLNAQYLTDEEVPIRISVPMLTVREKHWLDQSMSAATIHAELPFELDARELQAYRDYQRQYPVYFESLV